ncbi:MAG: histidine kinase [Lacibacter sp.]
MQHLKTFAQIRVGDLLVYENITGLNSGKLSAICPSADGYLWIGSESGLVRFDGYRYERMKMGEGESADSEVTDILQDSNNHVWIANANGIVRYRLSTGKFHSYKNLWKAENNKNPVNRILVLPNKELWFATGGMGLAKYNQVTDNFSFYQPVQQTASSRANDIIDLVQDKKQPHLLWLISRTQLFSFDTRANKFTVIATGNFILAELQCIEYDEDGLWLGTRGQGMYYYNITQRSCSFVPVKIQGTEVNRIQHLDVLKNSDSTVLLACAEFGLLSYHKKSKQFSFTGPAFRYDSTQKNSYSFQRLAHYPATGLFVSMEGAYLQKHPAYIRLNKVLAAAPPPHTRPMRVNAAIEDRPTNQFLLACNDAAPAVYVDRSLQWAQPLYLPQHSNATAMKDVVGDRLGVSWMLGNDGLLYKVSGNQLLLYPNKKWKGKATFIEADEKGDLLLFTDSAMYRWNLFTDETPRTSSRLPDGLVVTDVKTDGLGNCWIAGKNGLYLFDKRANKFVSIPLFRNTGIVGIAIGGQQKLWIHETGGGIGFYHHAGNSYQPLPKIVGYPGGSIHKIQSTADSLLLAATTEGLFCYNTNTGSWKQFNKLDGLFQSNLNNGMVALPDGVVFLNNFYHFHAFRLQEADMPLQQMRVAVVAFFVNGKQQPIEMSRNSIYETSLSYNQNTIQINFAAMNWLYPLRTTYQYRVHQTSHAGNWQPITNPSLQLAPLQPGTYTIELRAIAVNGVSSAITTVTIAIQAPFWKTSWFWLLLFLIIISALVLLFRLRLKRLRQTAEMRNSISRNLHDEIGSTLTSISILSTVSQTALENEPSKAKEMMGQIALQSKSIQQNMSDIVWAIRADNDRIEDLISRIREYIGQTLEPKQIKNVFEVDEEALQLTLPMQHRKELLLICKEAIHNILKHAGADVVRIHLCREKKDIQLIIADNGQWKAKETNTGTGLQSLQHRASSLGGVVKVNGSETGTTVTVVIPMP